MMTKINGAPVSSTGVAPGGVGIKGGTPSGELSRGNSQKSQDVRLSNIQAAKAVADSVRTSLGPRGMDKMICQPSGDVLITNDGATILDKMKVQHPAGKMLVQVSKSQDVVAGDGTTSVVVICGSLLEGALGLLGMGIHPGVVSESFGEGLRRALEVVEGMKRGVDLEDREGLAGIAATSLGSKVVGEFRKVLAPIAVEGVLRVAGWRKIEGRGADGVVDGEMEVEGEGKGKTGEGVWVDLKDVRMVKKLGGTLEDTQLIDGLVINQRPKGKIENVKNAKIAILQFCLSPPKTDLENNVVVKDYHAMDRILKEERNYMRNIVKKIKQSGCNCVLLQKSILRDATTDLSIHYLNLAKIMVVQDVERDEVPFLAKGLDVVPITDIESFSADKLGKADSVVVEDGLVRITGITGKAGSTVGTGTGIGSMSGASKGTQYTRTATILVRGSNQMVLDEAERSLHDALCVVRSLVKKRYLLPGGGAVETEIAVRLSRAAKEVQGLQSYCLAEYARAMEVIPFTLAENAGLSPIEVVTELRRRHLAGEKDVGVVVRRGGVGNVREEEVEMPLLVMSSALELATECVRMILKIDDIVLVR